MAAAGRKLTRLGRRLKELKRGTAGNAGRIWRRRHDDALRDTLRRYEDAVFREKQQGRPATEETERLRRLAARAFDALEGQADPAPRSLRDYDSERFGPYLGVSGEGNAAAAIAAAAQSSPKVRALGVREPLEIGVAHDAERLGSVGELPVGPDEYRDIRLQCLGRILTSTNIGARLNVRFYRSLPVVWVNRGDFRAVAEAARRQAGELVAPFLRTPDRRPRPITLLVRFRAGIPRDFRVRVLKTLLRDLARNKIGDARFHSLGLLAKVRKGTPGVEDVFEAIELAHEAGIATVAVEGTVRSAAEDFLSMPGLLQYFNPQNVGRLLERARARSMRLVTKNPVDTESVARHAWTGLSAARRMGLELGKYGLFPLSLEESRLVIQSLQRWFSAWTAAPAFYIDVPTLTASRVFTSREAPEAVRVWLKMAARYGVRVVLIDTVDKSKGRRLMKLHPRDAKGILRAEEIRALDRFALKRGVRALWAGGITLDQAYEFGRMGVFGIYVTTAATKAVPVSPAHRRDVSLAAERLPTRENVARVKLLLEAGFLSGRLGKGKLAKEIDSVARLWLQQLNAGERGRRGLSQAARKRLDELTFEGWRHFRQKMTV